jgi:ADP-ribosyl-[dinitrogen reductase] hydrolase
MNRSTHTLTEAIESVLFGVATGDALGVPAEFSGRDKLRLNPVKVMAGYGTYKLPPGTWSDDSSLTFCLAEALTQDFSLDIIGQNFIKWYYQNYWTPAGNVFDIGIATRQAIERLAGGEQPCMAGGADPLSNGNGSLMRILPLLFYLTEKPMDERFEITRLVSSVTHRHILSVAACFYYLEFARKLLSGTGKFEAYRKLQKEIPDCLIYFSVQPPEIEVFERLLRYNIYELDERQISSSGYVIHTLEASIWCLLTTSTFKEAVLKAVNLGEDTDTTGAVPGGLAGLLYGYAGIPAEWLKLLARKDDIENLAKRLAHKLSGL